MHKTVTAISGKYTYFLIFYLLERNNTGLISMTGDRAGKRTLKKPPGGPGGFSIQLLAA